MIGCDRWSKLWRKPQVYATNLTGGDVAALIVNWYEVPVDQMTFNFQDLGVVPTNWQQVKITDIWTGETVGTFDYDQTIGVKTIPGHGNFAYRLSLVDMPNMLQ